MSDPNLIASLREMVKRYPRDLHSWPKWLLEAVGDTRAEDREKMIAAFKSALPADIQEWSIAFPLADDSGVISPCRVNTPLRELTVDEQGAVRTAIWAQTWWKGDIIFHRAGPHVL